MKKAIINLIISFYLFALINNFTNKKRNLEEESDYEDPEEIYNISFVPLNIYLDLLNFNYTFPNNTLDINTKKIFIEAMNNAKNILNNLLYIQIDYDEKIFFDYAYFPYVCGIEFYSNNINNSFLYPYNYIYSF